MEPKGIGRVTLFAVIVYLGVIDGQLLPNMRAAAQVSASTDSRNLPLEIEVLLLRFDNPHGIVYSGKKCDFFWWGCDIKALGYIDVEKPYDDWPGSRELLPSDYFWYRGEESSPKFNHIFRKTICDTNSFKAGNLRVNLMDVDGGLRGADDFINNFNCIFTKVPNIADSAISAGWSKEIPCDAMYSNPLMGMVFKYRMYRKSSRDGCPA
ncbi:uncharacterized protein LOC129581537 [Paramacrobiotus metropolitanus]|uniref:uncharacterized protein LOC129581537 n=1 Tax=Paramacrobiotus metropolitanus TaxID=2943436 RepID=UPI002445DC9A|nr:uncharacterized protein LOC129581537 [Paramacrobiotus metropolitanus]